MQIEIGFTAFRLSDEKKLTEKEIFDLKGNKPDQATMRPGCVLACIDHVTDIERQMDEQTGEMTE